jgi:glycosyltransferase involved in cell wall biosynthesis
LSPFYQFNPKIHFHNIQTRKPVLKYIWDYLSGVRRTVKEVKPDIISVCDDGLKGFFIPKFISRKIPIIYERHASIKFNTGNSLKGKIQYFLMQKGVKNFRQFVVLSESNIKEWKDSNRVIVISNPLSFYPADSSSLQNRTVIAVGSHSYNKGYDLLLSAWKIVVKKYPDWKLNIYGRFDASKTYINLTEKSGLSDCVRFYAPVANIEAAYKQASIMVLSSRSEGFGNVLIEAMACGLPCVSFDCPSGPRDIITDGKDGFLVENGNIAKLAEKIIFLVENEDKRMEMGRTAKENVKRFLPEHIIIQWVQLFEKVLNN